MLVYAVNGYGAPRAPWNDWNLTRYLAAIESQAAQENPMAIVLCGGRTNRPDMSEAESMLMWYRANFPDWVPIITCIDRTMSARENVVELEDHLRAAHAIDCERVRLVYFCEWTRRFEMRFLCSRIFSSVSFVEWEVRGIKFDAQSLTWRQRIARYAIATPETVLAEFVPPVRRFKDTQRRVHLARERAKYGTKA